MSRSIKTAIGIRVGALALAVVCMARRSGCVYHQSI